MRFLEFIAGLILCLVIFGIPILGCFALLLAIVGVAVESAVPVGMFLTIVYLVGIGIKVFFINK